MNLNGVLNVSLADNEEDTISTATLKEICSFIGTLTYELLTYSESDLILVII